MRLGHARQLRPASYPFPPAAEGWKQERSEAIRCYETAIALGDRLDVRRTRAEAMWGLTRAYGFCTAAEGDCAGDLDSAERAAAEGIEIARWAGDVWVAALIELTLGASYVLAGQHERGLDVLDRALAAFRECGDTFGRAAARLWQGLAHHPLRQKQHLAAVLDELLALCETNGYDYLLTAPTLLGPPDPRRVVPLLLQARSLRMRPAYVARLLALVWPPQHPGASRLPAPRPDAGRVSDVARRGGDRAARVAARQGPAALPTASHRARPMAATRRNRRSALAQPRPRRGAARLQGGLECAQPGHRAGPSSR